MIKDNLQAGQTAMAFATYLPKEGKDQVLLDLLRKHLPTLRSLQLATDRQNYLARSENGTIIEVFEWASMNAVRAAHNHPAIIDIWEKIGQLAEIVPMASLQEGAHPFPVFDLLNPI